MDLRSSVESVPEPDDRADVQRRYDLLVEIATRMESPRQHGPTGVGSPVACSAVSAIFA